MFETPILLIIFNRPETTQQVFNAIRNIRPKYFYVAADGPRINRPEDVELCNKARSIIQVDWDCVLKTNFSEQNLGCGLGPSTAISWFFEQVEEGIILEDDCFPHNDFFTFCNDLLIKYRLNPQILSIAGSNFQNNKKRGDGSYYFSIHNRIWGWASWRRTWQYYNYYLNNIDENEATKLINNLFTSKRERVYWQKVFYLSKLNQIDKSAWDYQFMFLQWKLGGLTITPNVNLVSNIGYGDDATHTNWGQYNPSLNRPIGSIYPLVHPKKIKRNLKADAYYFLNFIKPKNSLAFRIRQRIKKYFVLLLA